MQSMADKTKEITYETPGRTRTMARTEVRTYDTIYWAALVLLVIGGLNWLLVGALNLDLVALIFGPGSLISRIIYVLVGLSAIYVLIVALWRRP